MVGEGSLVEKAVIEVWIKPRPHILHLISCRLKPGLLIKPPQLFWALLVVCVWTQFIYQPDMNAWAGFASSGKSKKVQGSAARGREVFNGRGVCYYCHGIDGYLGRKPRLTADIVALIARLTPPPTDLRNPAGLRLKTNLERSRAIREGHPGTGMFPDPSMTDQEIVDILVYLALLRKDPNPTEE